MLKRSKTKTIPGVGNLPYGYDKGVDGQSRSFYYPHAPTLEKLEEAILRIREVEQSEMLNFPSNRKRLSVLKKQKNKQGLKQVKQSEDWNELQINLLI